MTGDAYTLVSPEEESYARAIERAAGRKIERRTLEGFDYHAPAETRLEVPQSERIAAIRARKADDRGRAKAKAARRTNGGTERAAAPPRAPLSPRSTGRGRRPAGPGRGAPRDRAPR
jgi:ATP-dependent RNA helicase RhlE